MLPRLEVCVERLEAVMNPSPGDIRRLREGGNEIMLLNEGANEVVHEITVHFATRYIASASRLCGMLHPPAELHPA